MNLLSAGTAVTGGQRHVVELYVAARDLHVGAATGGEKYASPACTVRMADRSSAGAESFRKYPWAPARTLSSTYSISSCTESISTRTPGARSSSSLTTCNPDPPGIEMSSTTTCGASAAAAETASTPLDASPTTSNDSRSLST